MNREDKFVITISRQFGTGGHEIGAELARRLDVKLLDKQIINEVAKRNHIVARRFHQFLPQLHEQGRV